MKNLVLIIATLCCAVILGLVAAVHYFKADNQPQQQPSAVIIETAQPPLAAPLPVNSNNDRQLAAQMLQLFELLQKADVRAEQAREESSLAREQMSREIAKLQQQLQDVRRQLTDANRDIVELQFQIDAQSANFKPLESIQPNVE